ncbi:MAG: hypothetical protein IJW82_07625 [Clostridia bacterium]|nr:hypothetical protein [Clostridia bacterium]
MNLQDIDKAFALNQNIKHQDMVYYSIPNDNFDLYGVFYDKKTSQFTRMDLSVASKVNNGVKVLATNTSGGRLKFSTNSTRLEINVTYNQLNVMSHMAIEGSSGFMLLEENNCETIGFCKMLPPTSDQKTGYNLSVELPKGKMRDYVLWFPLYNQVKSLTIGLDKDCKVSNGKKYKEIKPILYYGSSITQGGCASRPDNSYPALISKWTNVDFVNFGFSGSGLAEENMINYLAQIDCSLFVCDYDHNAPNVDYLEKTHYRLYEIFRKVKKDIPILFLSAPSNSFDNVSRKDRKKVIKNTYIKAKSQGDNNVYFIDGESLLGKKDRINCMVDNCHPTDLGFYRMAKKIYQKIICIDEKFKG